jgi:hypothetical protein
MLLIQIISSYREPQVITFACVIKRLYTQTSSCHGPALASYEMRQVRYHHPVPQPSQGPRVCVCCHGRGRIQLLSWAYNIALRRCDLTFWALGCRGTGVKGCGAQQRRAAAPVLGRKDAKVLLNINWTRYQGRKGGEGAELLALGALSAWICWKEITGTCHMGTPICKGGRANPHVP